MKTFAALIGSVILGVLAVGSSAAAQRSAKSGAAAPQAAFVGPTEYATAGSPQGVWTVDLNGDGKRDALTIDGEDLVSVLLGKGDGSFERKRSYHTGPHDLADIEDLNGDGKLDLVTSGSNDEDEPFVAVFVNAGDGSFPTRHVYRVSGSVEWLAIGDLNGAGKPDIVTVNDLPDDESDDGGSDDDSGDDDAPTVSGTVSTLVNHGDGTFTAHGSYELMYDWNDFALEDLNHDGALDLVSANDETNVSVLLNNGGGGFQPVSDYKVASYPQTVAIHDVNGDGRPDLVTTNDYGDDDNDDETTTVSVLLNRGDGTFRDSHEYETGDVAAVLEIGDLNGDRRADIVTVDAYEGVVSVLLNNGDGSFATRHDYESDDSVELLEISDLNGDGRPELVTDQGDADAISVFMNDGDGGFSNKRSLETGSSPGDVAIGDVNGDGRRDLVVADSGQLAVSVLLNTMGDGDAFVAPTSLFPHARDYAAGRGTLSVAVGDLNGDGRQDLVTTSRLEGDTRNKLEGAVYVLLGSKNGFAEGQRYLVGLVPRWVAIGDLDKDGAPDLAVANTHDDTVSVLINKGDGTFKTKRDYPTGHRPYTVAIGDLDGDGSMDLATGDAGPIGGLTVSVLLNDGKGTFGQRHAYRTARAPLSVAIADLNGDGKADLVTANHLRRSVSVLLNAGNGTFAARHDYRVGRFPRSVAIGDLNGDGAPDLAVANTRDDGVSVLLNAGDGSFGEKHDFATGTSPSSIVIGDFDGDHHADLATNDLDGWTVCVLEGNGAGSFGERIEYPVPGIPRFLAGGDFDGNGMTDLVATLGWGVGVHVNGSAAAS